MIGSLHPALLPLVGSLVVPFLRGRTRMAFLLLVPAVSGAPDEAPTADWHRAGESLAAHPLIAGLESDETFAMWADRLQQVADSAEWKEAMAANGLAPFTKVGDDFQSYVDGVVAEIRTLSKEIGVIQ